MDGLREVGRSLARDGRLRSSTDVYRGVLSPPGRTDADIGAATDIPVAACRPPVARDQTMPGRDQRTCQLSSKLLLTSLLTSETTAASRDESRRTERRRSLEVGVFRLRGNSR